MRRDPCVLERHRYHAHCAVAIFGRLRDVKGVARHAVADDFGVKLRAAPAGVRQFFEHQNPRAFADDEAIAVGVERAGCPRRVVVARRQRPHRRKAADAHRRDGRLGAAADHRIGVTALDDLEAVADRMRSRRAGRAGRRVRPFRAEADRHVPRRQVDDRRRDEERRDLARPAFQVLLVLALDDAEAANP